MSITAWRWWTITSGWRMPSRPAVREWTRLENERTRAYFARLPFRDGIAQQLAQLRGEESARYYGLQERKGRIFALRFKPPAQQPVLVRLSSLAAPALWRTVFDPNAYNTNGTTAIDWYRAVARWTGGRGLVVRRRQRAGHAALLRGGYRQEARRRNPARPVSHGRRQRGVDGGRHGRLLHALSAPGRAAGGRR